eukprot:scaffold132019_cov34-Tisochrysis_lutea.AAC.1
MAAAQNDEPRQRPHRLSLASLSHTPVARVDSYINEADTPAVNPCPPTFSHLIGAARRVSSPRTLSCPLLFKSRSTGQDEFQVVGARLTLAGCGDVDTRRVAGGTRQRASTPASSCTCSLKYKMCGSHVARAANALVLPTYHCST